MLKRKVDSASEYARESYERYFNMKERHLPVFRVGDQVNIDKAPNVRKERADTATQDRSGKVVPKKDGPFKVPQMRNHMVAVDIKGRHNFVSIDRVCLAKLNEEAMPDTIGERQEVILKKEENIQNEYMVNLIVLHRERNDGTKNLVGWYGYSKTNDMWEPSHNLPQHFTRRYWER